MQMKQFIRPRMLYPSTMSLLNSESVKEQDKEIRRLKEENEFLEQANCFRSPAVGSQQKTEINVYCNQNG